MTTTMEPMCAVQPLTLSPEKVNWLWTKLSGRPSEFSDFEAPDPAAFETALFNRSLTWYEFPAEDEKSSGLICLQYEPGESDATVMVTMVDKRPGEKVEAFRDWMQFVFQTFPVNRLTMHVPDIHFALKRLVDRTHWRREGTKREAVCLRGKWVNVGVYGVLRSEV